MDPVKHHGTPPTETVVREFPPAGRYRIRLVRDKEGKLCLDVREYRTTQRFEGFTRRGVRIYEIQHVGYLSELFKDIELLWRSHAKV